MLDGGSVSTLVCLSVSLSVSRSTKKVMNWFGWNYTGGAPWLLNVGGNVESGSGTWISINMSSYKRLSTSLGSKTLNNTSSLGLGGNQNLRPSCRRPHARTFHTPVGTLRLDAPALVWVRSPYDGNKLGSI